MRATQRQEVIHLRCPRHLPRWNLCSKATRCSQEEAHLAQVQQATLLAASLRHSPTVLFPNRHVGLRSSPLPTPRGQRLAQSLTGSSKPSGIGQLSRSAAYALEPSPRLVPKESSRRSLSGGKSVAQQRPKGGRQEDPTPYLSTLSPPSQTTPWTSLRRSSSS